MRQIPDEMAARIESGAARLCHVWRLARADGVVLGFTDHDRDLTVDGVTCRAASGWTAGAGESAVGLPAGSTAGPRSRRWRPGTSGVRRPGRWGAGAI